MEVLLPFYPNQQIYKKLGAPKGLFGRNDETDETVHISGMDNHLCSANNCTQIRLLETL